ncbi:MAG: 3-dehydroquinate dehydratase [Verrucomicrobiota bacterium]
MMRSITPQIVGVIFSRADFQRALKMRSPPDLLELRLDGLVRSIDVVKAAIERLPAPLILTARHPREGGANRLSSRQRRGLLLEFMPHAAYVDIELRSAPRLAAVLRSAGTNNVRSIISYHDFFGTPGGSRLHKIASAAQSLGADIIKIATRTDTPSQAKRLLDFFERQGGATKVVAMGIGKLGRASRLEFARRGCALNYASLGRPQAAGQLSIRELRRALT